MANGATAFPGQGPIQSVPPALRKQREMLGYRYYDSVHITDTPIQTYKFFFETAGKTTFQTNMSAQSYIPKDEKFEIRAIGMFVSPTMVDWKTITGETTVEAIVAAVNVFMLGSWTLHVGEKDYNKGPLSEILSLDTEYIYNSATAEPAQDTALAYFVEQREDPFFKSSGVYGLDAPVTIDGGFPFYVQVDWNAAVGLASSVTLPFYFYCVLFGRRERRAIG